MKRVNFSNLQANSPTTRLITNKSFALLLRFGFEKVRNEPSHFTLHKTAREHVNIMAEANYEDSKCLHLI
jgi:hypothetical protein